MKFTPEVIAALAILREHAENDFELHFLDVLEQDLTAPPTVEIVDDEHQKFNGVVYTKNKFGHFYKNHDSIHRAVWTYYHGDIPVGNYEVHHIDHNKANNHIENLRLLTANEHHQLHNPRQPDIEKICPVCGKKFIPSTPHSQAITCSMSCKAKLIHQKRLANGSYKKHRKS